MTSITDEMCVLGQHTPGHRLPQRYPILQSLLELSSRHIHIQLVRLRANRNQVSILDKSYWTSYGGFWADIANNETVACSRVSTVRNECDVRELRAHDGS